mgnify:CR=1 FL=1
MYLEESIQQKENNMCDPPHKLIELGYVTFSILILKQNN